jgi:UDP-N-acetylglucosamine 1-carboxyvinyltransferase
MAALLTQASGVSYVDERGSTSACYTSARCAKWGREVVTTGTTVIISGPTPLIGTSVRTLDIRAGAALLLAALASAAVRRYPTSIT